MHITGRYGNPGEGPYMHIHFECVQGQVQSANFETYGCPSAIKCGDWVVRWAKGRSLESLSVMDPGDLAIVVGGLPLGKEFCADMTVQALRDAIHQSEIPFQSKVPEENS